ncbi:MAG: hypothetical protein K0Q94_4179 [Paenibacillus sp.]|nr:hypothetical protein [Paenibacillus sp.]
MFVLKKVRERKLNDRRNRIIATNEMRSLTNKEFHFSFRNRLILMQMPPHVCISLSYYIFVGFGTAIHFPQVSHAA